MWYKYLAELKLLFKFVVQKQNNMKSTILSTVELCRVTYNDGDFIRLMKQTYSDKAAFYYVTKGEKFTRVETASNDVTKIISQLEHELSISEESQHRDYVQNNEKVKAIYEYYIEMDKKFLAMVKGVAEKETYKVLNLKTDLPYLARLSKNFDEFCDYWTMEADKLKRLADDTFYKFKGDCRELLDAMSKVDKKHFFNYHTRNA